MLFYRFLLVFIVSSSCLAPVLVHAELTPQEIVILVNSNSPESIHLGNTYVKLRGVPAAHIIRIAVHKKESVSRNDYDELIAKPVRRAVNAFFNKGEKIRCLITTYGVPLKINAVRPLIMPVDDIEKHTIALRETQRELAELQEQKRNREVIDREVDKTIRQLKKKVENLNIRLGNLRGADTASAVDSELALVLTGDHAIKGMLPNPQLLRNAGRTFTGRGQILMISRLDAPTPGLAEGLIHTAIEIENTGLKGRVYLDARGKRGNDAYGRFDEDIRRAAKVLEKSWMPVILDDRPQLFGPGEAPAAALYCGWYSHAHYRDVFEWSKGAIGYHIASSEAVSLHDPKRKYWVKSMIERGVIASVGPVSEPYLYAFPAPSLFFPLIMSGNYSLAEVFAMTNPFLSWRMILIGDPLYNPFKNNPAYHTNNLPDPP